MLGFCLIYVTLLRAILCKYGASYIGTISRSDSDLMKLADSGSGHVKTRNQVLVHSIQPPLPWQQHPKIWAKNKQK